MFGSTRYMAPEEFVLGATIDSRTTVFTPRRLLAVHFGDSTLDRAPFRGTATQYRLMSRACDPEKAARFASPLAFYEEWGAAKRD